MVKYYFSCLLLIICGLVFSIAAAAQRPQKLQLGFSIPVQKITPEILTKAKANGIDYIETSINAFIDADRNFKISDAEIISAVKAAKAAADEAGIRVWSIHMPFGPKIDLSLTDDAERRRVLELHKKVIAFCSLLQPQVILFHPSFFLGLNERERRKNQLVLSATELNKAVKAIGATMVIENMFGPELLRDADRERPLLRTVEETVDIMNQLPADIYAAIDLNHAKYPASLIYAMGSRLKTIHVADGTDKAENHFFPCSGEGHNDWVAIFVALHAVKYKGPFMYESKYKDVSEFEPCYESLYQSFLHAHQTGSRK
ncbi:sugar phosphate isomerase/epimerase family protein [Niabella insulamsoli]|uniref:sugar phosphate isomerase/epimerase family protein n=1 Tax=Niabella insulamsoli TaxID=3144874 RepID=UPI0031FBFEBB